MCLNPAPRWQAVGRWRLAGGSRLPETGLEVSHFICTLLSKCWLVAFRTYCHAFLAMMEYIYLNCRPEKKNPPLSWFGQVSSSSNEESIYKELCHILLKIQFLNYSQLHWPIGILVQQRAWRIYALAAGHFLTWVACIFMGACPLFIVEVVVLESCLILTPKCFLWALHQWNYGSSPRDGQVAFSLEPPSIFFKRHLYSLKSRATVLGSDLSHPVLDPWAKL